MNHLHPGHQGAVVTFLTFRPLPHFNANYDDIRANDTILSFTSGQTSLSQLFGDCRPRLHIVRFKAPTSRPLAFSRLAHSHANLPRCSPTPVPRTTTIMKIDREYKTPDPTPIIICLLIVISFCAYLFFIGFNVVRLWYYRGALGPTPEKYLIVPLHRKKKAQGHTRATSTGVDLHDEGATATLHATAAGNRKTVFPAAIAEPSPTNTFSDEHATPSSQPYWTTIPAINIEEVDESGLHGFREHEDPELLRRYVAEERRISRLPAFEQDDCGDGTEFLSVPYATQAVEAERSRGTMAGTRNITLDFRLTEEHRTGKWLTTHTLDPKMQVARDKLLDKEHEECVQVRPDGEIPCEELLDIVVHQLCSVTALFNKITTNGRKYVRSRINFKEYAVTRPFEYHPIELCARLAGEDFNIFIKDEFTQKWYL
jgi:hypothetical protein